MTKGITLLYLIKDRRQNTPGKCGWSPVSPLLEHSNRETIQQDL